MKKAPKQVEEAAKRAEELSKQLSEEDTEYADEELSGSEETEEEVEASGYEDDEQDSTETEEEVKEQKQETDWEHKYSVLQGKYNKEVPYLQQQLRQMQTELAKIQTQAPTKEEPKSEQPTINPDDFSEYGDEFVGMAKMIKELSAEKQQLAAKLDNLSNTQETIKANQSTQAVDAFYANLKTLCPSWEKINTDSNFLAWLGNAGDQFGNSTRQQYLDAATQSGDSVTVAKIFNQFNDEFYKSRKQKAKPSLAEQAAPKSQSTQQRKLGEKGKKRIWTTTDIKKFYTDMANGVFRGDPDRAKKLEADLFAAQSEGRVRR